MILTSSAYYFERYKAPLFGYYYRTTRDVEISEDLVQSVFLRILKYRYRFSNEGKFSTWMYHIAHNVYKDHIKRSSSYQDSVDFSESRIVELRIHGATAEYVEEIRAAGLTDISLSKLVEFRIHGVNGKYVEHAMEVLKAQGKEVTPSRIVEMQIQRNAAII